MGDSILVTKFNNDTKQFRSTTLLYLGSWIDDGNNYDVATGDAVSVLIVPEIRSSDVFVTWEVSGFVPADYGILYDMSFEPGKGGRNRIAIPWYRSLTNTKDVALSISTLWATPQVGDTLMVTRFDNDEKQFRSSTLLYLGSWIDDGQGFAVGTGEAVTVFVEPINRDISIQINDWY